MVLKFRKDRDFPPAVRDQVLKMIQGWVLGRSEQRSRQGSLQAPLLFRKERNRWQKVRITIYRETSGKDG
jgi:hypothetical protein